MATNNNIDRLLQMLDHPEQYSEQEILEIINQDDETRETYRQLALAKRASRHHHSATRPDDVDEAWRQFKRAHMSPVRHDRPWIRMVATFVGILLLTGIAWAAIQTVRHHASSEVKAATESVVAVDDQGTVGPRPGVTETTAMSGDTVVYDNVPLGQMLDEMAAYYGKQAIFKSDESRELRFHFVWCKADGLDKVLEDLRHFERVDIGLDGTQIIVQ